MEEITVIIAHYAPEYYYRDILQKTIHSIRKQKFDGKIIIAVADDGSPWSKPLLNPGENIRIFNREEIKSNNILQDLDIDWYILGKRTNKYQKAILWNHAINLTDCDHFVFLDDDHPFLKKNSLIKYQKSLKKYQFVIGRLLNPDGTYRLYREKTVQGTNFGMKRSLLMSVEGFGEYTSEWGAGEDSDIFWKVFSFLTASFDTPQAVYAGEIITKDYASGRWKKCDGSMDIFRSGFFEKHGVDAHNNDSRRKELWVKKIGPCPKLMELKYIMHNHRINYTQLLKSLYRKLR